MRLRLPPLPTITPLLLVALCGCAWFSSHKTQFAASGNLLAQEAAAIAERTVYSKGLDAADVVLKNQNVQGFGDGLRTLETGLAPAAIAQIPDFVMRLRQIWLPPQQHYTDLAANLGTLIQAEIARLEAQTGRKLTPDETKQVIEGVIKGLQTSQPAALAAP
jgi:hypothetical protein